MAGPHVECTVPVPAPKTAIAVRSQNQTSPRVFKKHKALPRSRNPSGSWPGSMLSRRPSVQSNPPLSHQRRNISGGDLPPIPPAHSRTSSSSHSASLSNLSPLQTPSQSSEHIPFKSSPNTPPSQRSPLTPDVTPPQMVTKAKPLAPRPTLYDRVPSKCTTDSRTESFKTARESPELSDDDDDDDDDHDDDDGMSPLRPEPASARTSQATVRSINRRRDASKTSPSLLGLGLGFESSCADRQNTAVRPNPKSVSVEPDEEWRVGSDLENELHGHASRNSSVRKRRPGTKVKGQRPGQVVDDCTVSSSNAAKAVRTMPLHGRILTYNPPKPTKSSTVPDTVLSAGAATGGDAKRSSSIPSASNCSTVVAAILVETPPRQQQQRTLRHVKRVDALRDSIWQSSRLGSVPTFDGIQSRRQPLEQGKDGLDESFASNTTALSARSRPARRQVRRNGGIPVVDLPDRHSSSTTMPKMSSNRENSLSSTSSQRSKRSQSLNSTIREQSTTGYDSTSYFDRPDRRGRPSSESDGSLPGDQRTMDFPPAVPRTTSSLSASTSRNGSRYQSRDATPTGSRVGSLTAESCEAHQARQAKIPVDGVQSASPVFAPSDTCPAAGEQLSGHGQIEPAAMKMDAVSYLAQQSANSDQWQIEALQQGYVESRLGDSMLSNQATPFSQMSIETNAFLAADIGEARVISMVPHQKTSVLVVDYRPSDVAEGDGRSQASASTSRARSSTLQADDPHSDVPPHITPRTKARFSPEDADSPLRTFGAPLEPPAIQFIPATPSGLTPAEEKMKMLGNFYDEIEDRAAESAGTISLVRRAFSKRRHSIGHSPTRPRTGFLTRTLSYSRKTGKAVFEDPEHGNPSHGNGRPCPQGPPRDSTRLHPDWRPSHDPGHCYEDDGAFEMDGDEEEVIMRYRAIEHRPSPLKRSLSERMKRAFAIMPLDVMYDQGSGPGRRTVKRTLSGNLRVVRYRGSEGSLCRQEYQPSVVPESRDRPSFWCRSSSTSSIRGRYLGVSGNHHGDRTTPPRTSETRMWSMPTDLRILTRKLSEKRRMKRSNELRQKISAPQEVRDGMGNIIRNDRYGSNLKEWWRQ